MAWSLVTTSPVQANSYSSDFYYYNGVKYIAFVDTSASPSMPRVYSVAGSVWTLMGDFTSIRGSVGNSSIAVTVDESDGSIYAALPTDNGESSYYLKLVKWTGSAWSVLATTANLSGLQINGSVKIVASSGKVYIFAETGFLFYWNGSSMAQISFGGTVFDYPSILGIYSKSGNLYAVGASYDGEYGPPSTEMKKYVPGVGWSLIGSGNYGGLGSFSPNAAYSQSYSVYVISDTEIYVFIRARAGTVSALWKYDGSWSNLGGDTYFDSPNLGKSWSSYGSCLAYYGGSIYIFGPELTSGYRSVAKYDGSWSWVHQDVFSGSLPSEIQIRLGIDSTSGNLLTMGLNGGYLEIYGNTASPVNTFSATPERNGIPVVSTIDGASLITKVQADYADTYFDSISKVSKVYMEFTHSEGRQRKRIVHTGVELGASVSWSVNAKAGVWQNTGLRAYDHDGATHDLSRASLGADSDITIS